LKLGRGGVVWVINLAPYQAPKTNLDISDSKIVKLTKFYLYKG